MVGVKEEFVILLFKRMFGLDNGADDSKKEVSDVEGLGNLTGQGSE